MFSVAMIQIDQNINIKLSFRKRESNLFIGPFTLKEIYGTVRMKMVLVRWTMVRQAHLYLHFLGEPVCQNLRFGTGNKVVFWREIPRF